MSFHSQVNNLYCIEGFGKTVCSATGNAMLTVIILVDMVCGNNYKCCKHIRTQTRHFATVAFMNFIRVRAILIVKGFDMIRLSILPGEYYRSITVFTYNI